MWPGGVRHWPTDVAWNFELRAGLNLKQPGHLKVQADKNQELARIIGTRLREACGRDIDVELPTLIAVRLAALRDIEVHAADTAELSLLDAIARQGATCGK